MNKADYWTTAQGQRLEIRWMQTQHLVHAANMVIRNNKLTKAVVYSYTRMEPTQPFGMMVHEIHKRDRLVWQPDGQLAVVDARRETPIQLAMLRAILDTQRVGSALFNIFNAAPDDTIARIVGDPEYSDVNVKFTEYRLAQG